MKKTFFQRTYNLNANLIVLALLSFFLKIGINLLIQMIETTKISGMQGLFTTIIDKLTVLEYYIQLLSFCLILVPALLVIIELVQRFRSDSISNYFKSIFQTIRFRHFLKQDEKIEAVSDKDNQTTKTGFDPIIQSFNNSISKCTIDVRNSSVSVVMQYPKTQQAQKILREMTEQIKEEISSYNPGYIFSAPTREGDKLWFKATRV